MKIRILVGSALAATAMLTGVATATASTVHENNELCTSVTLE